MNLVEGAILVGMLASWLCGATIGYLVGDSDREHRDNESVITHREQK